MKNVYITSSGIYLPNQPISNDRIEKYLGEINGQKSAVKERILKQNGIKQRYFAMNTKQESTHSNAQLAIKAIEQAVAKHP